MVAKTVRGDKYANCVKIKIPNFTVTMVTELLPSPLMPDILNIHEFNDDNTKTNS